MARYFYDFHLHSCLSPCANDDMTPANIAGMAKLKGLDMIALTDHNSCKNCRALLEAAGDELVVVPGMEINTVEEIHAVCLFPTLKAAMAFDELVYDRLPPFQNDPAIYGRQQVMDVEEHIICELPKLLISGCRISMMELRELVGAYQGLCFPAHIEKSSYSLLSVLGAFPPECGFTAAEINDPALVESLCATHPALKQMQIVTDSDAHYLWDISERTHALELEECSIPCLFDTLRQAKTR